MKQVTFKAQGAMYGTMTDEPEVVTGDGDATPLKSLNIHDALAAVVVLADGEVTRIVVEYEEGDAVETFEVVA